MAQQRRHCSWYTIYTNFIADAHKVGTAALNLPAGDCIPLWTPPCSAPTRGGHGRGKPLRSKSTCWRTMIYCYPSASSDQSRIRLTYHHRPLSIQVCSACCGVRLDRYGGPIDALFGGLSSPKPPSWGGEPPRPPLGRRSIKLHSSIRHKLE